VVSTILASAGAGLVTQDWIPAVAIWVLAFGWYALRTTDGPPVLAVAFTFQWIQVTVGMFYLAVTGSRLRAFDVTDVADYRPMVLLGLGCLVVLAVGLRVGMWVAGRYGAKPAAGPERAFSWRGLILLYAAAVMVTGGVQELAWEIPSLTQGILALTFVRLALLYLMLYRLSQPRVRWAWMALILVGEIVLGSTGYFAGFREPIMIAAVVLLGVFDRRRAKHWLVLGMLGVLAVVLGLLWTGVRKEFRQDFHNEVFAQSREARLRRIAELTSSWTDRARGDLPWNLEQLVDRLWAIPYPALALERVPALVPHENGAILWRALVHLATPRLIFSGKPELESDSESVFKYAGVLVAGAGPRISGADAGTSIAFGYAGEAYVDFGVPLMFLPVLIYGFFMGVVYSMLLAQIWHRELAFALTTVIFWLSLYLFERSWIKMLGVSATLIIYLGGTVFVVDRVLRRHHRVAARMRLDQPRPWRQVRPGA
jgi:hypothetical protein